MIRVLICLLVATGAIAQPFSLPMIGVDDQVSGGAPVVPAFVRYSWTNNGGTGRTTAQCTITNTAGNTMLAFVQWLCGTNQTVTMSDSKGNTWTAVSNPFMWNTGSSQANMFVCTNVAAGSNQVRATLSGSAASYGAVIASEYSGVKLYQPVDVARAAFGVTSTTAFSCDTGAATTTANGDALVCYAITANSGTFTPGSGYSTRVSINSGAAIVEDQTQSSASANTHGIVIDSATADNYMVWLVALLHQ